MTRVRLRPAHSAGELADLYRVPHDHTRWPDHVERVDATIRFAREFLVPPVGGVADLSCGSAAIARGIGASWLVLGDVAAGYEFHGPIERTVGEIGPVDVFVCCETLEHLDDPDKVLAAVREKARYLILSTPVDAWNDDNVEHYWAWSRADVDEMLVAAGWVPAAYRELRFAPFVYTFGVWGCT